MNARTKRIVREAQQNPWRPFSQEELATLMGKSREFIAACKREGAPFPFGHSRPEWIIAWLSSQGDALNEAKIK